MQGTTEEDSSRAENAQVWLETNPGTCTACSPALVDPSPPPLPVADIAIREVSRSFDDLGGVVSSFATFLGDQTAYGPKAICGDAGCIILQTNPISHYVRWGIAPTGGLGVWNVDVYINGVRRDAKRNYIGIIPHGSFPPQIAPPGSAISIQATRTYSCGFLSLFVCYARSIPNVYVVPP